MAHTIGIDARKLQDFGIGTYVRQLITNLAEIDQENRYVLLTAPQHRDALADLPENFRAVTERSKVYSLGEFFQLTWKLYRLKLDLYHATHYVLPAICPCKVVVTIHDIIHLLYPEYLPNRFAFFYAQRMIRHSLSQGDRIITVSKNTRRDLQRYYSVSDQKIQVIYNGVEDDFRRSLDEEQRQSVRQRLDLERPYILFVGNPKPHKNLPNVLRAYARARELGEMEAQLVVAGDKDGSSDGLKRQAEFLRISEHVRFLGHVDQEDLPALYQNAELFLYPTLYEGFGLPVIEAMASGVAVITSDTSALKEIAEGYAHLVSPLDVEEMARAIAHCMRDGEHRGALAKLGRRRSADFRWQRCAKKTLEIYRSVLEPERQPNGSESPSEPGKRKMVTSATGSYSFTTPGGEGRAQTVEEDDAQQAQGKAP
ncbi:MAG: glycosyltransferase family 1 protein [Acidobacteriota bacterium]